jgi:RNA-directed DNA polymerase
MRRLAERLATAFLAGPWDAEGLCARGARAVVEPRRWLARLARQIHAKGEGRGALRHHRIVEWILHNQTFLRACERYDVKVEVRVWEERPAMLPASGPPSTWRHPPIETIGQLAEWLGIRVNELEWFAGYRGARRPVPCGPLAHYRYRPIKKRHGEIRLLEIPKSRLRALQRQVLRRLLDEIPAREAAHGFRAGRSVRTFADPHAGQRIVIRLDLCNFFPTIRSSRIAAIFLTAGYPEAVADPLAGLCTHAVARELFDTLDPSPIERRRLESLYGQPHLPQGPTSPALSNLVAYRFDCRLSALAASAGARYTRYADDLAFSGGHELERSARRFQVQVAAIALEEGFSVNARKTRIMRNGVRQQLAGVVVNHHPNLPREEFDRLKALLHNCNAHGPASQNRDQLDDFRAHLAGRVAYWELINPARGRRLRMLFNRIAWQGAARFE